MLSEKRWQPIQVLMLGVLVLLSLVGGAIMASLVNHLAKPYLTFNNSALLTLVITALGFQGAALIWIHLFLRQHEVTWADAFGFARHNYLQCLLTAAIALPLVLGGMLVLGALSDVCLRWLHEQLHWGWLKPEPQTAVQLLRKQWPVHLRVIQGFITIIVAPVAEEILFRGILYTTLKQRGHQFTALWMTSFLFALIHGYPVGFLSLVFLAVVLALLYERTRNLLAPILLHAFFNAVNFAVIVAHPKWAEKLFQQ